MNKSETTKCFYCGKVFDANEPDIDTRWIEWGTYSEKVANCPRCNKMLSVKQITASGLYVNYESKYYQYN